MAKLEIRKDLPKHMEIVAVMIGGQISNSLEMVIEAMLLAANGSKNVRFLTRWEMLFMAHCNFGPQWEQLAQGQAYFGIDEQGKPCYVEEGVLTRLVCKSPNN